jgi:hypothetical protein
VSAVTASGARSARAGWRACAAGLCLLAAGAVSAKALDCAAPTGVGDGGQPNVLAPATRIDPAPPPRGAVTFAMLPDIQYYTKCGLPHLANQMRWLAEQSVNLNIRAALFMGDLTEHNAPAEWQFVHDQLDAGEWQVPMLLATGNHDHGRGGHANRRGTLLTHYFAQPPGIAQAVLAETRSPFDIGNAYYRIPLARVTIGVLVLEWAPRTSTVAWANQVLSRYPHDRVIVVTHAYLYDDSTRYDWRTRGKTQLWSPFSFSMSKVEARRDPEQDGEMLWNSLVRRHPGVFLLLCGHVGGTGTGYLASRGDDGNVVHQVLANFQLLDEGGLGYLRLFEIQPDGRSLRMKTYSPSLDLYATADTQTGSFEIEPALW